MIPYGRQHITQQDIDAVVATLQSDFLTQGPAIPAFEQAISARCQAKHAIAVSSATAALHLACLALGLKEGDTLWTSPITFVASANCALYCRARVDFVDIAPRTFNMCPEALEKKLTVAAANNHLPKIIIAVHMAGQSCDMHAIGELCKHYNIALIEDASHAIGGQYQDAPVGNCAHADCCIFSFHPVKVITTGEGGVATTNNDELATKMRLLREHGITRNSELMPGPSDGPWVYQQIALGFNYRMTDIQAALGTSQLSVLADNIARRHEHAKVYDEAFSALPLQCPFRREDTLSSFHLYIVQLDDAQKRLETFCRLRERGIGVNVHYIPVYRQPFYREQGFRETDFPSAEEYYARAMTLPLYPMLTPDQRDTVISAVQEECSR